MWEVTLLVHKEGSDLASGNIVKLAKRKEINRTSLNTSTLWSLKDSRLFPFSVTGPLSLQTIMYSLFSYSFLCIQCPKQVPSWYTRRKIPLPPKRPNQHLKIHSSLSLSHSLNLPPQPPQSLDLNQFPRCQTALPALSNVFPIWPRKMLHFTLLCYKKQSRSSFSVYHELVQRFWEVQMAKVLLTKHGKWLKLST